MGVGVVPLAHPQCVQVSPFDFGHSLIWLPGGRFHLGEKITRTQEELPPGIPGLLQGYPEIAVRTVWFHFLIQCSRQKAT